MTNINLYKKMHLVMNESEGLEKSMEVGTGKNSYSAISEKAVLNVIKPLLKDHGLLIFPVKADISECLNSYEDSYGKQKNRLMSQVKVQYKIVDIDSGEFEILETVGNGSDTQDKGSGKAWTYAYKALLQKTFCLFSGEDTDNTHSDDIGGNNQTPSNQGQKVTTKMLQDAIEKSPYNEAQVLARYKADSGNSTDDIKFIKAEYKIKYYNELVGGKK